MTAEAPRLAADSYGSDTMTCRSETANGTNGSIWRCMARPRRVPPDTRLRVCRLENATFLVCLRRLELAVFRWIGSEKVGSGVALAFQFRWSLDAVSPMCPYCSVNVICTLDVIKFKPAIIIFLVC